MPSSTSRGDHSRPGCLLHPIMPWLLILGFWEGVCELGEKQWVAQPEEKATGTPYEGQIMAT